MTLFYYIETRNEIQEKQVINQNEFNTLEKEILKQQQKVK